MRELLFSVTKNDLEMDTFRAGGKGGQAQNKKSTGVRIRHKPSGATGEGRDSRSFEQNRKAAFVRMTESKEFKAWHKIESARRLGIEQKIQEIVDKETTPDKLKIEVFTDGEWVEVDG